MITPAILILCLITASLGWRWQRASETTVEGTGEVRGLASLASLLNGFRARLVRFRQRVSAIAAARFRSSVATPPVDARSVAQIREDVRLAREELGPRDRWVRRAPLLLVAVAILFGLWSLRAERLAAEAPNDSSMHLSMMNFAEQRMQERHLPFDSWYPYLGLGSPHFREYQSFPHIVAGTVSRIFGAETTFFWSLYLLLALWPLSIYWSARLFGWDRWTAALASLVSPLLVSAPGYGYEWGSYIWRGLGTWSQLWAMWLLPLAWALSWQAVARKRYYALAALAVALTIAAHFLSGYLALLTLGVWVVLKPPDILMRLGRAAIVGVGAILIGSWVVVPLLTGKTWITQSQYFRHAFWADSFGAKRVLGWLFSGNLFDAGRPPIVTILVFTGLLVCIARFGTDERARAVLGAVALSLLLYFGRPTLGPLINLLPGSRDLLLHRYIIGVHLGGIFLAGIGAMWLAERLLQLGRRLVPMVRPAAATAIVLAGGIAILAPAWTERAAYAAQDAVWIHQQRAADASDGMDVAALIKRAESMGPGRFFSGSQANWGASFTDGHVPVYSVLLSHDADAIGFTGRTVSLSEDVEFLFDESNLAQYDLFNVRYLIFPTDRRPLVSATFVERVGKYTLWTVHTSGYMQVVDVTGPPIVADRIDLARKVQRFLESSALAEGRFPSVAFAGAPAAPPTTLGAQELTGPAGTVTEPLAGGAYGVFAGTVHANRPAMVVLKESFDPRWKVLVDGKEVPPQMVAPSFVGREIPAGDHTVAFVYESYPHYGLLLTLGVLTFLLLAVVPTRGPRRRVSLARGRTTGADVARTGSRPRPS